MVVDANALCEVPPEDEVESPTSSDDESTESSPESPPSGELGTQLGQLGLQLASRTSTRRIDPLEVRFSQMKARHLFGDGRRVADTVEEIKAVRCTEAERKEHGVEWRLAVPFPVIEVIRWHCKLRDPATGRPMVDPETGEELIDKEERWFTLDNRRLYCLQEAASRVWPARCVADVCVIIAGPTARMRELRKFRTLDQGRSVLIGSRSDGVAFVRWSWRAKVGIHEPDEADKPDEDIAGGMKVARPEQGNVLEHLASLQPDDFERIEISKKLSWVLRRGLHEFVADDGWVKVEDVLQVPFLDGIGVDRLLEVVEDSNKQKWRYQLKDTPDGRFIRASGKKGVADEDQEKPAYERPAYEGNYTAWPQEREPPIGAARGTRALGKNGLPRVEGRTSAPEVRTSAPLATPEKELPKESSRAVAAKAKPAPVPVVEKEKSLEELLAEAKIGFAGNEPASAAGPQKPGKKPAGASWAPPGSGVDPKVWQSLVAKATPGARPGATPVPAKGSRPPGVNAATTAVPQMQFAQQMQAMRQMFAISARYQMQVRSQLQQLMQARMLQQMQALQAMHAANELRQMQAMREMQLMYENMQAEWAAEGWGDPSEYAEAEDGLQDAEQDESVTDLDARIQQALEAAVERNVSAHQQEAEQQKAQQQFAKEAASKKEAPAKDPQQDEIQAKIAEALGGALKRNGVAAVQTPVAKPSKAVPSKAAPPANIESKIAEAVSAAKERSGAVRPNEIEAKIAEALSAAKTRSGAAAPPATPALPAAAKKPAVVAPPTTATALQAKFAEALEAARSRSEAAKAVA